MPDPVWYYARGDVEKGPLSSVQIKALAAAGKIRPDDYVWKEGMDNWLPAGEVKELFPAEDAKSKDREPDSGKQGAKGTPLPSKRKSLGSHAIPEVRRSEDWQRIPNN